MSNETIQQPSLIQLVYVSAATVNFSSQDLDELLENARERNSLVGVTGVLLYQEGTFLQVLEGDPNAVQSLYEKISLDTRHTNVLLLASRVVEGRNFGNWSMAFVRDREAIEELPGFVDFFKGKRFVDLHGDSRRVSQILDGFRRGRWRRQCEAIA